MGAGRDDVGLGASPRRPYLPEQEAGRCDLYERDILLWSERQALLLRPLAAGERVNDLVDWENLIEEVQSVGREQMHAVEALLFQALVHSLKAQGWPLARDAANRQADARGFRSQAANRFAPSMRQRLDLDRIHRQALRALPPTMDGVLPLPLPERCPVTLDELLGDAP
ncbi:MAG: DUF29 domain-containing protein [Acetobacteraceae bacterium]